MALTPFRTCNLCEAMCGIAIDHEDGRILAIRGDPQDPFSAGHVCPKAVALKDVHEDPDRLRRPLRRRGSSWEEVSWEEALQEAAGRHWDEYMRAYEDTIRATSTGHAPWYVVPADRKWYTRLVVAAAIVQALEDLELQFPRTSDAKRRELAGVRAHLAREGTDPKKWPGRTKRGRR